MIGVNRACLKSAALGAAGSNERSEDHIPALSDGEGEEEGRSFSLLAFDPDLSAVRLYGHFVQIAGLISGLCTRL
jgi:hypothetical protein